MHKILTTADQNKQIYKLVRQMIPVPANIVGMSEDTAKQILGATLMEMDGDPDLKLEQTMTDLAQDRSIAHAMPYLMANLTNYVPTKEVAPNFSSVLGSDGKPKVLPNPPVVDARGMQPLYIAAFFTMFSFARLWVHDSILRRAAARNITKGVFGLGAFLIVDLEDVTYEGFLAEIIELNGRLISAWQTLILDLEPIRAKNKSYRGTWLTEQELSGLQDLGFVPALDKLAQSTNGLVGVLAATKAGKSTIARSVKIYSDKSYQDVKTLLLNVGEAGAYEGMGGFFERYVSHWGAMIDELWSSPLFFHLLTAFGGASAVHQRGGFLWEYSSADKLASDLHKNFSELHKDYRDAKGELDVDKTIQHNPVLGFEQDEVVPITRSDYLMYGLKNMVDFFEAAAAENNRSVAESLQKAIAVQQLQVGKSIQRVKGEMPHHVVVDSLSDLVYVATEVSKHIVKFADIAKFRGFDQRFEREKDPGKGPRYAPKESLTPRPETLGFMLAQAYGLSENAGLKSGGTTTALAAALRLIDIIAKDLGLCLTTIVNPGSVDKNVMASIRDDVDRSIAVIVNLNIEEGKRSYSISSRLTTKNVNLNYFGIGNAPTTGSLGFEFLLNDQSKSPVVEKAHMLDERNQISSLLIPYDRSFDLFRLNRITNLRTLESVPVVDFSQAEGENSVALASDGQESIDAILNNNPDTLEGEEHV